jgi:hypothetical protein
MVKLLVNKTSKQRVLATCTSAKDLPDLPRNIKYWQIFTDKTQREGLLDRGRVKCSVGKLTF